MTLTRATTRRPLGLSIEAGALRALLEFCEELAATDDALPADLRGQLEARAPDLSPALIDALEQALRGVKPADTQRRGKMIVVTGIDRSGKETHCFNPRGLHGIVALETFLGARSHRVLGIRQPSYETLLGGLVAAYLGGEAKGVTLEGALPRDWAWLLWSLDRAQHNARVLGWLGQSSKHVVLAKRWTESNVVYQQANGLKPGRVLHFERHVAKPDFVLILDVPVRIAAQRLARSPRPQDAYEQEPLLQRVRELYLNLATVYPYGEIVRVDAARSPVAVNEELRGLLTKLGF